MILTGQRAIEYAEKNGLLLSKYSDPIESAREDLTVDEAQDVARQDPGLIYIETDELFCSVCGKQLQDWPKDGTVDPDADYVRYDQMDNNPYCKDHFDE